MLRYLARVRFTPAAAFPAPRTRQVYGLFGTHRTERFLCGLCHNQKSFFPSADAKAAHLRVTHRADVVMRKYGYSYTASVPI